ncbi:glycoside hydrolase family 3 C-terminal domain-containing protein [Pontibacter chitinilyticus]|uniref:glycoside hydrolase family 3 C-terminal domain-containing protein n=1 Tax=Pontibacter chitinilyticus TaxID=2674989 RepID=UPI00321911A7
MKYTTLAVLLLLPLFSFAQGQKKTAPQLGKAPIQDVVAALTLEEKAKLVVGNGFSMPGVTPQGPVIGETKDKVPGAAGTTFAVPRLGIPSMVLADGPAGVRILPVRGNDTTKTYYATAWPVGTLLASSWDTVLVQQVGKAFGNEVLEYGIDIVLAPALNIHRNPLGGRNFEYFSEDPVIAGNMAAAIVNGIEANGVGTSIKHFAANNQETNRNTLNTIASERALREIYLKGFEIAVKKSQPWTVMSSYNFINGTYTSESYDLLTTLLRKEWGFKGFVMTDWFGGKDPVAQMKAGNDLLMPGTAEQTAKIIAAVKSGELDEKVLDMNITKILQVVVQSPAFKGYAFTNKPDLKKHAALSRMAAAEGMVLLKNEGETLPFRNVKKIALFGNTSYDIISGGTGSGDVNEAYTISLEQGLKNAGYTIDEAFKTAYTTYIEEAKAKRPKPRGFFDNPEPIAERVVDDAILAKQADNAEAAIITIGRNSGEGSDRKVENDFTLTEKERDLIKRVSDAFHVKHKKVAVVLNIGGVMEVMSWRNQPDAILLAWQPGLEAGNAIADVLSGKVNPSGKLATTFPVAYTDVPSAKSFPGKEFPEKTTQGSFGMKLTPGEVTYDEGIYVGYRYYNTFNVKPAYPFGYGLSYTNFSFSDLKLSAPDFDGKLTATLTVKNTGKVAGKEVVQVYLTAPKGQLDKPELELKHFAKTKLLKPGEAQTFTFTILPEDLTSFDTATESWVADAGEYVVKAGNSSQQLQQTASFRLPKQLVTEKVHQVLAPQTEISELKK